MRARKLVLGGAAILAAELALRTFRHAKMFEPSPDPVKSWDPADYGIPASAVEEHWIETPDGETLHAWYCRAEKPVASGLFCHGNKGNLTVSADIIPHLLASSLNILFFDYRGYGKSSGSATYRGVISDGITAARFHDSLRPKHLPSILYGFSLGGAVAAQVIRRHAFDALILQSTFTSLPSLTRVLHPRVPLHLFARKLFDTLRVIRRLDVPLLVLHGTDDEVIPCWMAHEIFDACKAPKRMHSIEGGLHKDLYLREPDTLIWALTQFLADVPKQKRAHTVEPAPRLEYWSSFALRALRRVRRRRNGVIASATR
ncbi:MAG TPA: alpha/beta hydrolase [Thermoanaerobaculia bacterium]|nr:alpha/beta hydrolase [Thermoanaerobaculia bacterium]